MSKIYWTKKRIKATNWQVGPSAGAYNFSVVDYDSGKTMAFTMTANAAHKIIAELKQYGCYEPS